MRFRKFVALQLQYALSSALAIGLVVGLLLIVIGGVQGAITVDIDLSASDSIWFIPGIPLVVTVLFVLCSPLSFCIQRGVSRVFSRRRATAGGDR